MGEFIENILILFFYFYNINIVVGSKCLLVLLMFSMWGNKRFLFIIKI